MRQLHVVAVTSDGKSLLLAGAARGAKATHQLAVDKRLHAALAGELYAEGSDADGDESRQESALSPREMQARLRAGASVEDVARMAGVPIERIERYAGPVESERNQVIDAVQSSIMERPRWGASARALGDAVIANLAAVSDLKPESVGWSTRRRADGCWVVRLEFTARGRRRVAEWEWEPHERIASPIDTLAASMGYIEPRSRARARATAARSRPSTSRRTSTRKTTRKKTAMRKTTRKAASRTAKRTTKSAAGRKKAVRKTAARKATARKTAARKTAARKTTARKTAARKTTARKTTRRAASTTRRTAKRSTGGRRTTRRR